MQVIFHRIPFNPTYALHSDTRQSLLLFNEDPVDVLKKSDIGEGILG